MPIQINIADAVTISAAAAVHVWKEEKAEIQQPYRLVPLL